jgi:IstB-like ATP binding protein
LRSAQFAKARLLTGRAIETEVLGSERLTGALLDRLTYHLHILEMNGDSYRLKQSKCATGGTTRRFRHSSTNPNVSNPFHTFSEVARYVEYYFCHSQLFLP